MITIEKEIYDILKQKADEKNISVPAMVRHMLINYFDLEDDTKDYKKNNESSSIIVVGNKTYYRLNTKMRKENEIYIKEELKRRKTTINKLLKELIILTA
jgi:predicted DNA-binding ribbon-helix-helix protein